MSETMNVVIVGIGAMGGGMARALLDSEITNTVVGYDKSMAAVELFFQESQNVQKAQGNVPLSLKEAITNDTNVCVISLVNEVQCEEVCFGGEENLLNLMPKGSCVVMTSTVTASWAQKADRIFREAYVMFVDCPVSGGPARARDGDLTLIASGEIQCLDFARPILDALAREIHVITGGAGGGSTVKCVHQLLAGVHICAAAEAMAMAAKAGIDVSQLYNIVNGAAGASWMFTDRGKRMLEDDPEVKSALAIFVKDLDIVYAEAKKLMCPIPVATAALQQFISGQSLGLGTKDDSQVVKVYENVTKVPVAQMSSSTSGSNSHLVIQNEYVKVSTCTKTIECNQAVSFSCHGNRINLSLENSLVTIDLTKSPPILKQDVVSAEFHELIWETEKVRVYRLSLPPGQSTGISYPFFHLSLHSFHGTLKMELLGGTNIESTLQWSEECNGQTIRWNPPTGSQRMTNTDGVMTFEEYIVEFR